MRVLIALAFTLFATAALAEKRPPFILILVPGLKAHDILRPELQPLQALVWRGAYGWMNSRTARVTDPALLQADGRALAEAACVTINAGSRAAALPNAGGFSGYVAKLVEVNSQLDHPISIGALGDMLHRAGLKTAVMGRADDLTQKDFGRLIAMDSAGRVDHSVAEPLVRDSEAPFGIRANIGVFSNPRSEDFQVWVFGDLMRAELYAPVSAPSLVIRHREDALSRLGQMLDVVSADAKQGKAAFLLVSPQPANSVPTIDRLAPILRFGYGVASPGRLYSPSTRTDGLVTNTDILPTIAAYFGIAPPRGMIGRAIETRPVENELRTAAAWAEMYDEWLDRSIKQSNLGGLPVAQFVLVLAAIAARIRGRAAVRSSWGRVALALSAVILTAPLAQIIVPAFKVEGVWPNALLLMGAALLAGSAVFVQPDIARELAAAICVALVAVIVVDLLTGQELIRNAWMSYTVMEGARYYGIGNEYAGAALGAVGSLGLLLAARFRDVWLPPAFGTLAVVTGLPYFGADAGSLIACVLAGAAAFAFVSEGRKRVVLIIGGAGAAIILISLIALSDVGGASQSHIGRTVSTGGIGGIIKRKAALNAYLLLYSKWTLCLIAAASGVWLTRRGRPLSKVRKHTAPGAALIAGTLAMLLFNDSGVIAAANLVLIWFAVSLTDAIMPSYTPPKPCA